MKKERYVILALCAEIRVHISYKSLAQPADEFRLKLIEYIEDAVQIGKIGNTVILGKEITTRRRPTAGQRSAGSLTVLRGKSYGDFKRSGRKEEEHSHGIRGKPPVEMAENENFVDRNKN